MRCIPTSASPCPTPTSYTSALVLPSTLPQSPLQPPPPPPLLPRSPSGSLDSVSSHIKQASPRRQDPGTTTSAQGGMEGVLVGGGGRWKERGGEKLWPLRRRREDTPCYEQMSSGPKQQARGTLQGMYRVAEGPSLHFLPEEPEDKLLCPSPLFSSPRSPVSFPLLPPYSHSPFDDTIS